MNAHFVTQMDNELTADRMHFPTSPKLNNMLTKIIVGMMCLDLTWNLMENAHPQLSQLAEPLWTDPGLRSGILVLKLISNLKKK